MEAWAIAEGVLALADPNRNGRTSFTELTELVPGSILTAFERNLNGI